MRAANAKRRCVGAAKGEATTQVCETETVNRLFQAPLQDVLEKSADDECEDEWESCARLWLVSTL